MSDSSGKRPMTIDDLYQIVYVEDPRISPDGQWIAYVQRSLDRLENGYKTNIWLAPTGGGKPVRVTRGGKDSQPRWSPDGTTLAFVSARNEKPQVYLLPVNAPGGEPRPLTEATNGATFPAWSPDGTQIAYLSRLNADERAKEDAGEAPDPPEDKLDATQRKERKDHDEKMRFDPRRTWRIPYRQGTSFVDDRHAQIYIIAIDETLEGDDKKPRRLTDLDADYGTPVWSPDGSTILTDRTLEIDGDEPWRKTSVFTLDAASGDETQLTDEDHADGGGIYSPDGSRIAYVRRLSDSTDHLARFTVMAADGSRTATSTLSLIVTSSATPIQPHNASSGRRTKASAAL